ncbi:site-specific integrase [Clostridium sporogenes]|uniref:site-specific integrase n=1 Tax=Clostridium sporogenes TaxID=1509 RepID=UPI0013D399F8|nr:site-specific integrase [Clostridium sporogenes]NFH48650.1 site-specific integrase [Clostridium sporogenes]
MAVYKNEQRGTYYCSFYYTDWTGKRKRKKKEGFKRQKDAKDYEREFLNKQSNNTDITFNNLVDIYLDDVKNKIRQTTFKIKENIIKTHISPYFKDMNINSITPNHIRKWQNNILGEEYSSTYSRAISTQLSAVFNFAVKYYGLKNNPVVTAGSIGKNKSNNINFWTVEQFKEFIKYIKNPKYKLAYTMLFWTGMRVGELLALTFKDIDLENGLINIDKTYVRIKNTDVINPPKTPKSKRKVTIPAFLCKEIKEYKDKFYESSYKQRVFHLQQVYLSHKLKTVCTKKNLKKIRVHDLRHSHASLLIELGFTPLLISERLGHESVETTLNIYSHLYPNKDNEVAIKLNELF